MAYAAVISLHHTIARLDIVIIVQAISNSAASKLFDAYQELKFLDAILQGLNYKRSKSIDMDVINEVDARIRDAVWKLEDVYESYHHSLLPPYQRVDVDQEIDSFLKTVMELREEYKRERDKPLPAAEDHEAAVLPLDDGFGGNKLTTVGLSDLSQEIRTQLLSGKSKTETISIWGMAGIGKTHLARQIFQHPLIVQHFDIRVWLSFGPKYEGIMNMHLDILAQVERKPRDVFKKESWDRVKELLRNSLRGRRFLIIFDDSWSCAWDSILWLLPNDKNGSRLLITTRLRQVAESWRYYKTHQMPFLSNEESWDLLWKNVFADESNFPPQLEKAGRKIAEHCEGLPLLIRAVADILRGLDKTEEYWNKVAQKKTSVFTDAYDQIYDVLLTSYHFIAEKLKPCFLYVGVFPQSLEIPFSKLSYLWILEDFVEPSLYQKWETNAMTAMEDLVSNSLAIVCKRSLERVGRIKSCKLHSAYWYLCITEARKNKLFHVLNKLTDVTSIERSRRLSVQNSVLFGIKGVYESMAAATSTTRTRTLLFTGEDHQYPVRICLNMMLLVKVLDALAIRFYEFPKEVLKLLLLRYLALTHNGELPSSINKLKHLEWLTLSRHHNIKLLQRDSTAWLPEEIWDMKKLRYLRIMGSNLPVPRKGTQLMDLETLYVNADSCREDVFKSLPILKKLGIKIEIQPVSGGETLRCLEHIGVVDGLESLKCVVVNAVRLVVAPSHHLSNLPRSLKKLSLNGLGYSWKYMSVIGSLPNLRVLKLRCYAFQGAEWETEAGQFKRLEFLLLEDIDLLHWRVKRWLYFKCFPRLRHLILRHCYKLKKIPRKIGEGGSLERMEVDDCSPSVVASAEQIKKKRTSLQVVINSSWNLR